MSAADIVDLRSDTVTRPTAAMRAAMAAAEVGDDVFGDDPSVNALQEQDRGDARQGGGALRHQRHPGQPRRDHEPLRPRRRVHRRPDGAHVSLGRRRRGGRSAASSRSRSSTPPTARCRRRRSRPRSSPTMRTTRRAACSASRTRSAARPCRSTYLTAACALAKRRGLATHLDGARLFNAATSLGGDPRATARAIAAPFDSVSVCFSKGLGAPVGSALVGSREFIARAHRWRKMLGGGMRQAGVIAAAALHALDHHIDRLADDHALATRLADGLAGLPGLTVERPQSNIVFADLAGERAPGLFAAPEVAWRARDGPVPAALRHPPRRRRAPASTAPSPRWPST